MIISTMHRLVFISILFWGLTFIPQTLSAQSYSESELQEMYLSYLKSQGMDGSVDSDGDVQFTYEDRTYFIEVSEDDPNFFRVVLFNFWPIESHQESVQVAFACNEVNNQMKVAKAYMANDNTWMACELFVDRPDHFKAVFMRCLKVIDDGVDIFVEEM